MPSGPIIGSASKPLTEQLITTKLEIGQFERITNLKETIGEKFPLFSIKAQSAQFLYEMINDDSDKPRVVRIVEDRLQQFANQSVLRRIQSKRDWVG